MDANITGPIASRFLLDPRLGSMPDCEQHLGWTYQIVSREQGWVEKGRLLSDKRLDAQASTKTDT